MPASETKGNQMVIEKDALARHLGIEILDVGPGHATTSVKITKQLLNGAGITHGGLVFSLADVALAAACNSRGPLALALNVNISFLKATHEGSELTAFAQEENLSRKTGLYRIEVKDAAGECIAIAQGVVYRKTQEKKGE